MNVILLAIGIAVIGGLLFAFARTFWKEQKRGDTYESGIGMQTGGSPHHSHDQGAHHDSN